MRLMAAAGEQHCDPMRIQEEEGEEQVCHYSSAAVEEEQWMPGLDDSLAGEEEVVRSWWLSGGAWDVNDYEQRL